MMALPVRSLTISCLLVGLLAARAGEGRLLLHLPSHCPSESSGTVAGFDQASSTLDAWLNPYGSHTHDGCGESCGISSDLSLGAARMPTNLDWWSNELSAGWRYRFADPRRFVLLRRYTRPGRERTRPAAALWSTRLDPERFPIVPELAWGLQPDTEVDTQVAAWLTAVPPIAAPAMKQRKCPAWARPQKVVVTSWGSDYDRLSLIDCDGNIDVDALDRISSLARIIGQTRPDLPLPNEPNPPEEWPDEWVAGVRLLHPRLLWILQRIGEAFPRRTIHIISGYRRDARDSSPHRNGRALDLFIRGLPKEQLFAYCMTLGDVGCGYYPYHPFVHVDVRPFGSPKIYWVDASKPGEHSNYVDGWPGVIDSGALVGAESD
jgi:hypothetical protein